MSGIDETRQGLERISTHLINGESQAKTGKSHMEEADPSFKALDLAKLNAGDMAVGIVKKLSDLRDDIRKLSSTAEQGQDAANSVSLASREAEGSFNTAYLNAEVAGVLLSRTLGTKESPPYIRDAVENGQIAQQTARGVQLEGAIVNGTFSRFIDDAEGLHTLLESAATTLSDFANALSDKTYQTLLKIPEENRKPEFAVGAAAEAITAFEAGIADADQRLGDL